MSTTDQPPSSPVTGNEPNSSEFNWDRDTKTIIDRYHDQEPLRRVLIQHHLESYNNTVETVIPSIVQHHNPVQIFGERNGQFKKIFELFFEDVYMCRPLVRDDHETIKPLYPSEARQRNLTYAGPMFVDVKCRTFDPNQPGDEPIEEKIERKIPLCNFPVMLGSNYCHLSDLDQQTLKELGENLYEMGGYFIINGSEKAVVPQERPAENKVLCFPSKGDRGEVVEIKSTIDQRVNPVNTVQVRLSKKKDSDSDRILTVKTKYVNQDINLFVMFRALGITSDQEIIRLIMGIPDQLVVEEDNRYTNLIRPTAFETFKEKRQVDDKSVTATVKISNQVQALKYIATFMQINTTHVEKEAEVKKLSAEQREDALEKHNIKYVKEILARDFLPHMGRDLYEKACYLGYMVKRLLDSVLNERPYDDRDHYSNKRLDLVGILLIKIVRENMTKAVRDLKKNLNQLLNQKNLHGVDQAVRKILSTCKIDSSLKYALSTGDWSNNKTGIKPSSTVLGIAQVLQRTTHMGTVSHLRRLQSPLEKEGGKLVPPRKLHGTQNGFICPNETPEGQQVGTVKNLAMMTKITIDSNSDAVLFILKHLGLIPLKRVDLSHLKYTVKVFVNGTWIGNARNLDHAQQIYRNLVYYKRTRSITTGVSWNYEYRELSVRTDGGRYMRPLYLVDFDPQTTRNELLIGRKDIWSAVKDKDWKSLLLLGYQGKQSLLEYVDCEEEENAHIATTPKLLNEHLDGDPNDEQFTYKIYTHCEIHPTMWLGVLSIAIPFSDHNQSPRNCYQCLWKEETVVMADGSLKKIKDILVGDRVKTVNPQTYEMSTANVINQYVKPTDKKIVKLNMSSGQSLICTDDHPIMTSSGWIKAGDLKNKPYDIVVNKYGDNADNCVYGSISSIEDHRNVEISDITIDNEWHSFITGSGIVVHNSAMGKQAVGPFVTNFNQRMDTGGTHILCYPQKPLVAPRTAKYFHLDELPSGQQCVVAISTFTGYNQEDSVILNGSFVQRGGQNSIYYKSFVNKENKRKSSTSEEEHFGLPPSLTRTRDLKTRGRNRKHAYRYLDPETGIIRVGTKFTDLEPDEEVALISKYISVKGDKGSGAATTGNDPDQKPYRDISTTHKAVPGSIIDKVIPSPGSVKNVDGDGNKFVKVREAIYRQPEIGDKFASRAAQKGTVGIIYQQEDMPFTASGMSPQIIMNPHAIPSRMTIGQLLEMVIAKVAAKNGMFVDCTAFTELAPQIAEISEAEAEADPMLYYKKLLAIYGFESHGEEVMYNPQTGEQFEATIFICPTYYQRLKHMVQDKIHARETGPVKTTTRQPSDGRSRDGGFRLGEMERDCAWEGLPISLSNNLSIKIRDMGSCDYEVFGWSEEHDGIIPARQTHFMDKGERECVELTYEDGRTVICTPDHPILTSDNQWVKAKDLEIGVTQVKASVNGPVIDLEEELKECADWSLSVGSIKLNCKNKDEFFKSMAFARIIGYLITDGHLPENKNASVYLGHNLDVQSFIKDLSLFMEIKQTNFIHKKLFSVRFSSSFTNNLLYLNDLIVGKKSTQSAVLPDFITDEDCPRPIVREFLGGLFGGDGHTCYLGMHRGKRDLMTSVSFSQTKSAEHIESLQEMMEDIQELLRKCGIERTTIQKMKETTHCKEGNYDEKHYEILLHLDINELIPFSEKIGFRYCCHKTQRLEAGVAYKRLREGVCRQRTWLINRVDEICNYSQIKKENPKGALYCSIAKAIDQAVIDLKETEAILHPYSIPNRYAVRDNLLYGTKFGKFRAKSFPTAEQFIEKIGALDWFSHGSVEETNKNYGVTRGEAGLPTMNLTLIGRRDVGPKKVYDITVDKIHNFLANGVVAHNCVISHGASQLLKERLMDSADMFRVFVHRKYHTIVVANPEKGIYRYGQEDLNPEDVVEVQMPYSMKLFWQELTSMGTEVQLIT